MSSLNRLLLLLLWLCFLAAGPARAEQHRATFLGHPSTRFAPPLSTPDDLRARFRDEHLRGDIAEVLRQWGWTGKLEDLWQAALNAPVRDVTIPVGETMPFMSSRENGKPICLRNVLWAGKEPAPAYAFNFRSNGRLYRCVTPKACSNFFVEDQGLEPLPALAIECVVPAEVLPGRPFDFCLTVRNDGTGWLPKGKVHLPVPDNVSLLKASAGFSVADRELTWGFTNLPAKSGQQFCAVFNGVNPGPVAFQARAEGEQVSVAQTACSTRVIGIPAILIDAIDLEDPVQVGNEVTYEIKVTNQGNTPATRVRLDFTIPPNEQFVSGDGPSAIHKTDDRVGTDALAVLDPKGVATWRVVVKAVQPGDVRFQIELSSDQFQKPIHEEESTKLY